MQAAYRPIRIGLLGAGSVGSQVARLLIENREELAKRVGAELELVGIAVRNKSAKRDVDLPKELITEDAESVILGSDIVIELAGGIEPAKTWIKMALNAGADVITANKALIAAHGTELTALAQQFGSALLRGRGRWGNTNYSTTSSLPCRRQDQPGNGHRKWHHQLHPRPDGNNRRKL